MSAPNAKPDATAGAPKPAGVVSPESKRDEFRRYLERTGVMDALTRVLVGLYEETTKPLNPVEYFVDHLSTGSPMRAELDSTREAMTSLQTQLTESNEENKNLRVRLEKYEPVGQGKKGSMSNANPAGGAESGIEDPTAVKPDEEPQSLGV